MQMSGLVLDVFDDFNGETLRALYPTLEDVPTGVKQAHSLQPFERERLPDDVFALVMVRDGEKLRKYACIDGGNTTLAVGYFLEHGHKLPPAAQKTAAANLITACGWYDLEVPEALQKVAFGLGTAMTAMTALPVMKGTGAAIKQNLAATKSLEHQGAGVVTPQMRNEVLGKTASAPANALREAFEELKVAELSGTSVMPSQPAGNPTVTPTKAVIPKTAMGRLVPGRKDKDADFGPIETNAYDGYTKGKTPAQLRQAGHMRPTVDVSGPALPKPLVDKLASSYALPSQQKYPLDSYAQVKAASAYFDMYRGHMAPDMRREFAENLVPRADALTIPVSYEARKYGSAGFAPEHEIKAAFDARRIELVENTEALALLGEVEKVARIRMWKSPDGEKVAHAATPDAVVGLLAEFDKVAGLNHRYDRGVPDPFFSIYGFEKTAAEDPMAWSDTIGNDYVTLADLKRLAQVGPPDLTQVFGADFVKEFRKDPQALYESMPTAQKKVLMRMASAVQPGNLAPL